MHWYVVGASAERLAEIRAADHLVDSFEGPLDRAEQAALYRRIAHAAPDGLWLTWSALEPSNLDDLRRLRVAQPGLAMILEIPTDLTPPNPDLAQVVGLGIYGIVPASASFEAVNGRAYTYADGAAWQGAVRSFDEPEPEPKEKIVERIVEKEIVREVVKTVATSTRPTVIAVAGSMAGIGTTSIAVNLARYLANQGWAVALSEHGAHATLASRVSNLAGIAVFPALAPDPTAIAAERRYAYVVSDFGCDADWPTLQTHARPDLALWVIPGDAHRWGVDLPMQLGPRDPMLGVVGPGPDQAQAAASWTRRTGIPAVAWSDQPEAMRALLGAVLPDTSGGRRWFPRARKAQIIRQPPAGLRAEPEPDPLAAAAKLVIETRTRTVPRPSPVCRGFRWVWRLGILMVLTSLACWLLTILGSTGLIAGTPAWLTTAEHLHATEWQWMAVHWPGLMQRFAPTKPAPVGASGDGGLGGALGGVL